MHAFKDTLGRTWELSIHLGSIRRVKALTGIDLPGLFGDELKPLLALAEDQVKFGEVLWVLVQFQAEKSGVSEEQFLEGLAGDKLENALRGFLEELADFFPSAKTQNLRKIIKGIWKVQEKIQQMAEAELARSNPETWADELTSTCGAAPASSELTPPPSL